MHRRENNEVGTDTVEVYQQGPLLMPTTARSRASVALLAHSNHQLMMMTTTSYQTNLSQQEIQCLVESGRAASSVDASRCWASVRQREAQLGGEELLDVGAADILGLLDLDDLDDL